jgi:hypothetical protein
MFCAMLVLISDNKAQLGCFIHFLAFLATGTLRLEVWLGMISLSVGLVAG